MVDKIIPSYLNPEEIWKYDLRELTKYNRIGEWIVSPTLNTTSRIIYRSLEFMSKNTKLIALSYGNGHACFCVREEDIMHTSVVTYDPDGAIVTDSGRGNEIDLLEDTYYYYYIDANATAVIYDLGMVHDFLLFYLDIGIEPGYVFNISVETSPDKTTWSKVFESSFYDTRLRTSFTGTNVRYVRLRNSSTSATRGRVYSIECFKPTIFPRIIQGDNSNKYIYFLSDGNPKSVALLRVIEI